MTKRLCSPTLYTIGWIAALPIERAAATALLHDRHDAPEGFSQHQSDTNSYTWGQIGEHNIVIVSLPAGIYGVTSAATTASNLVSSLPHIRFGLLVGIGGGIARPSDGRDVRLGDIVVSQPDGTTGGVVQYDLGKAKSNQTWERKGSLNMPPLVLLNALASLQAEHHIKPSIVPKLLQAMLTTNPFMKESENDFTHQGFKNDRLFKSDYNHTGTNTCDKCDASQEVERLGRGATNPKIHYGVIASGNTLVKDAATRDSILAVAGEQCICVEMEAAGLMNHFPCLVIRGICDYADSHKNDRWQRYASATAAAFAVELLGFVPPRELKTTQQIIDIEAFQKNLRKIENMTADTKELVHDESTKKALRQLPLADGASFDSHTEDQQPTCLRNTRVEILDKIMKWADDKGSESIYWLQGMAGTGKSTISRTVARNLASKGSLGASFFFKRNHGDCGKATQFFTTIAGQLAHKHKNLVPHIVNAIKAEYHIADMAIKEQFEKLVFQPLNNVKGDNKIVVVVDALDECDNENDVQTIIGLFFQLNKLTSVRLKVFVASRPEESIRSKFKELQGNYRELVLQDIRGSAIWHDISKFLASELKKIRDDYEEQCQLPLDWPSQETLQNLATMTSPLFIFAATCCRFIADKTYGLAGPEGRLEKILEHQASGHKTSLNDMYLLILSKSVREEAMDEFQAVVGSILILFRPFSRASLAHLLSVQEVQVKERLDLLHSVLRIPTSRDDPIELLHTSFREFLINRDNHRRDRFWINEARAHERLATNCLRLLHGHLNKYICDLEKPETNLNIKIETRNIYTSMSQTVQYACVYWVHHLKGSGTELGDRHQAFEFLRRHFLHWLEVLSSMRRISESIRLLDDLQSLVSPNNGTKVSAFIYDAKRFILNCSSIVENEPRQLYSSALVFAPQGSVIREIFGHHINWISVKPITERHWGPCLQTLEPYDDQISSVSFSADGTQLMAGGIRAKFHIWDVATGAPLQSHGEADQWARSVMFSTDGSLLALGLNGRKIKIVGVASKTLHGTFEGLKRTREKAGDQVSSVAISADNRLLASGWDQGTIMIWDIATTALRHTFEANSDPIKSVAFSSDNRLVASGWGNEMVKIWDTATGTPQRTLIGHTSCVNSIAFSADGRLLASGSNDRTIMIWDATTGELHHTFQGSDFEVESVAFCPNSRLLASGWRDGRIIIWDVATGRLQHALQGHGFHVKSVAFSPDSRLLASGSNDGMVKIWDVAAMGAPRTDFDGLVTAVTFSADGNQIASGSSWGSLKIWDAATGALRRRLEGHQTLVRAVAFSPDGRRLASASYDVGVRIWDPVKGVLLFKPDFEYEPLASIAFSSDGTMLATGSDNGTINIWDSNSLSLLHELHHGIYQKIGPVAFSADDSLVASVSSERELRIWDVATDKLQETFHIDRNLAGRSIAFADGWLGLSSENGSQEWWPIDKTGRERKDISMSRPRGLVSEITLGFQSTWIEWKEDKVLWVPPDYRPFVSARSTSTPTIALGCQSGRVFVISFTSLGPSERRKHKL